MEALAEAGQDLEVRALTKDLLRLLPVLSFASDADRARFFYNLAVFLGSRGPAGDLSRALEAFEVPLAVFASDPDERARTFHGKANALANLGTEAEHLGQALALYEEALVVRNHERRIARAVTLHNMGAAFRRLAELDPEESAEHLRDSERVLLEALTIRREEGLREGEALTLFQLGLTLEAAGDPGAARAFLESARGYEAIGKENEATLARRLAAGR